MKNLLLLLSCVFFYSCTQKQSSMSYEETATEQNISAPKSSILNVISNSELFAEPNDSAMRLINHKATEKLGYTNYLSIDASCVVEVTDSTDNWYKIRVVEPHWLKETHIGWVPKEILDSPEKATLNLTQNIDYHFLKRKQHGEMLNLYFSYYLPAEEATLLKVAKSLKETHAPDQECNIYIFDTKDLMDLIDKYPLEDEEYLKVADHFIFSYDFSNSGQFYPFQDIRYKELGGKNWKKSPIE